MASFGKATSQGKFYTGNKNETPWNKDLQWQKHIGKEESGVGSARSDRSGAVSTRLGVTGAFISESEMGSGRSGRVPSLALVASSRSRQSARSGRSQASGSITNRSASSMASSSFSSASSLSSRQMAELKETIKAETRSMQELASKEISTLREAMALESKRREDAEKKIEMLTSMLEKERKA
jgi:hypothetical protein